MTKPTGMAAIGIGWYHREDWPRLLQMVPDRAALQDTYDEWLSDFHRTEKTLKQRLSIVKRIIVVPEQLAEWCAGRGLEPVASTRAQ